MKLFLQVPQLLEVIDLYPTWFRLNFEALAKIQGDPQNLYPTWFRWNGAGIATGIGITDTFISHMVQMKPWEDLAEAGLRKEFISHMVQMKRCSKFWNAFDADIYIPHGSDETQKRQWKSL